MNGGEEHSDPAPGGGEWQKSVPRHAAVLVERVNGWALTDIPIPAALVRKVDERHYDDRHERFIAEHNEGMHYDEAVSSFDLTKYCHYHSEDEEAAEFMRSYFAERVVDVVMGTGQGRAPYGFTFDWIEVRDSSEGLHFSFIFNLQD